MTPKLTALSPMAFLKLGASTSRATTMIASPETPMVSLTTGPTFTANRSLNRAGLALGAVMQFDCGGQLLEQLVDDSRS